MTPEEVLIKIKAGLSITGVYNDDTLKVKMLGVQQYMINAGVTVENIETDLGIIALTVGVNDLWNLNSGEVKFSQAFKILLTQLQVVSLPDV